MESGVDFLYWLDPDMSLKILMCLDDPSDLVRVSCVSRSWRHYVIANGLCKQLCLRMFPHLSRVARVVELNEYGVMEPAEVAINKSMGWQALERDHRVYAYFIRASMSSGNVACLKETIGASSTDHFPEERIDNTLVPHNIVAGRASYWSSKGQSNPAVPETLTYKLVSQICVITEISVHPFQAFFQSESPIYSAKSVRFKMGHPKASIDASADEKFVWTYISPEFPMAQENRLQKFKLPESMLCIGGVLQIELLGRVQRQEIDGLFYICVSHVQVEGRSLSPEFSVEIVEPSGRFVLKSVPHAITTNHLQNPLRDFLQIATMFGEDLPMVEEDEWDEEEDEVEEFED